MIIVTGGAGFIGSNLVNGLNAEGHTDILIVDDLGANNKFKNLVGLRYFDYCHKDEFVRSLEAGAYDSINIQALFHQGACSDTMEYDGNFMMATNYEYSKKLLHYCLKRRIPFLYASSASTYGSGQNGFREEEACESALNTYAFSKLSFDRYVRQLLPQVNSLVVGLRYFNVFGPQEQHKGRMTSIFYQLYNQMKDNGYIKLFKGADGCCDGEQKRDFIYVKDVVKINLWFYNNGGQSGIYNCGTSKAHSFNEVAQAVINYFSKGYIQYIEFPSILKDKYQNFTEADVARLLAVGYDGGFHSLEDAITEYYTCMDKTGGYLHLAIS
ncbi:ADP-L-glycero-D-mannoheptose-6-epimerase [Anaerosporomusa subterranea]|uniref:ADP-L-glycero-D-manno-heptose-6-epimerase n=1 Tax=Anaerosporomusa subterranea TaxID=1794912 RepID=A0A154BVY8_ANASB|nr:ADP-glyceromanno-heptose 6-epimerase [Anaerosporomusa subterranea]KYZ78193.1 ADP-L-glycero-D-mannoheptose-6-epimerase [Anaerosporomusa subterranea]